MKIGIICAPGVGDALILHIASHQLKLAGFEVVTETPHSFGRWLSGYRFGETSACEALFLQHDNSLKANQIQSLSCPVYTFYGSYHLLKHPPLRKGLDFVCDLNRTMVENVVASLEALFSIRATPDNGFRPPPELTHRKHKKRVVIHATSGHPARNWPERKFLKVARWLEGEGYEPSFLPLFPSLEQLSSYLYESGFFLGNDSGPGHLASLLEIPYLIIGRQERHMRHWRPGWGKGAIIVPPKWVPNWKGLRLRDHKWKTFITSKNVINTLERSVLNN